MKELTRILLTLGTQGPDTREAGDVVSLVRRRMKRAAEGASFNVLTICVAAVALAIVLEVAARGDVIYCSLGTGSIDRISDGTADTFVTGGIGGGGIAVDASGNLFAANGQIGNPGDPSFSLSFTISEITPSGAVSTFLPSGGRFADGLVFDGAGNLYVGDGYNGLIDKISPNASVTPFASGLYIPSALAFDANGNLYVADEDAVVKITPGGAVSTVVPATAAYGLACDASGDLYFSDAVATISKMTPNGTVSTFATGLAAPTDLAFDSSGNLYASESGDGTISKITPDGIVSNFASGLAGPMYIAIQTPEPSSLALLSLGTFALLARRRRW
jgi:sugar lactone lactonase YvrE